MSSRQKVAVIGCGIIGVSSALRALELCPELDVHILSEELTPNTTADGSAGFWNPYLLGDVPLNTLRFWCRETFQLLKDIYGSPEAAEYGVGLLSAYELTQTRIAEPLYSDVYIRWERMNRQELDLFPSRYSGGVCFTTFYAECTKFIPMLMRKFQTNGGKILQRRVDSFEELAGKYDIVINCTGVGASYLVPDPNVKPIRGQVIRVRAPWIKHAVMTDDDFYILPNSEEVICGGTHQVGDWNTKVDPKDSEKILNGCMELVPTLKKAEIIREWVGLRPGRPQPRLEREILLTKNGPLEVIHNYGHGGSGVTLFWGCALHAANILKSIVNAKKDPSSL